MDVYINLYVNFIKNKFYLFLMGNKVYIVKSADNSVFNPNVSLE